MSYFRNAQQLETASARLVELVQQITHTVQTGRDSVESAAKVAVLSTQAALASTDFWEALSRVHMDNLSIAGEAPCENSNNFADWARRVARDRTYAPFSNSSVSHPRVVDLRPVLAAE